MEAFHIFERTSDYIIAFLEKRLIHLHYGNSTTTEEDSTREAQWTTDTILGIYKQHPGVRFCIIGDSTRADNSELVSDEATEIYKKLIQNPQTDLGVMYGTTAALGILLQFFFQFTRSLKKAHMVRTKAEADAMYKKWFENQQTAK
jgi:hypothetical protein